MCYGGARPRGGLVDGGRILQYCYLNNRNKFDDDSNARPRSTLDVNLELKPEISSTGSRPDSKIGGECSSKAAFRSRSNGF